MKPLSRSVGEACCLLAEKSACRESFRNISKSLAFRSARERLLLDSLHFIPKSHSGGDGSFKAEASLHKSERRTRYGKISDDPLQADS